MRSLVPVFGLALACSGDPALDIPDQDVCLVGRSDHRYCIWKFEASRKDATGAEEGTDTTEARSLSQRVPWTGLTWEAARGACRSKGLRLCERDEWIDACDGAAGEVEGTVYTYGDTIDETRCNVGGDGAQATGSLAGCTSSVGVLDLSGNVWEWTGDTLPTAVARGGGFRSTQTHRCKDGDTTQIFEPSGESPEVGFRCCRDQ